MWDDIGPELSGYFGILRFILRALHTLHSDKSRVKNYHRK